MEKQILSEIDLYSGEPKTPKGFEIDRTSIKNDIINEYLAGNPVNKYSQDYQIGFSKSLGRLNSYIHDHFQEEYNRSLIPKSYLGNVYGPNQKSFPKYHINPLDLNNSADYTFIYGLDIAQNSCDLVIKYNDNRRVDQTWNIPMKNNFFVMFPSTQKYFFSPNQSEQLNTFLITTYEYV
jgi:hypothetical protein